MNNNQTLSTLLNHYMKMRWYNAFNYFVAVAELVTVGHFYGLKLFFWILVVTNILTVLSLGKEILSIKKHIDGILTTINY